MNSAPMRAAIEAPRRLRFRARIFQFRHRHGLEIAERIEIRLQISPAAKRIPDSLLRFFWNCRFYDCLFPAHHSPKVNAILLIRIISIIYGSSVSEQRQELSALGFRPGTQQPAHQDKLPQVVGIVVREQQSFAQNGLAGTMRNRRGKIRLRIGHEFAHRLQIFVRSAFTLLSQAAALGGCGLFGQ